MDELSEKTKEEIIAILNLSGIPFQDWAAKTIITSGFHYDIELPYSTPNHSGTIDIVADCFRNDDRHLLLAIEAKKANPQIKNWIFIKDNHVQYHRFYKPSFVSLNNKDMTIEHETTFRKLGYSSSINYDKCINAFESNSKFRLNRSSEEKIYKPLLQIHRGINGLIHGHIQNGKLQARTFQLNQCVYIPVIVTTADLFIAEYDPENVILPEGELDPKKQHNLEKKKWVTYEFPLSEDLKNIEADNAIVSPEKLTTFIVDAQHWKEFIENIANIF